jgi:hypothetical protein
LLQAEVVLVTAEVALAAIGHPQEHQVEVVQQKPSYLLIQHNLIQSLLARVARLALLAAALRPALAVILLFQPLHLRAAVTAVILAIRLLAAQVVEAKTKALVGLVRQIKVLLAALVERLFQMTQVAALVVQAPLVKMPTLQVPTALVVMVVLGCLLASLELQLFMLLAVLVLVEMPKVLQALAVAVMQAQALELLAQQIRVVVAVAVLGKARLAVQALSLSPTQAQHNYLVVELLPNQAVTSFTHSHLLAHLALCHL